MQAIKNLTITFIFLTSHSVLATSFLPFCNDNHTNKRYNHLYQSSLDGNINIDDMYHLGITSLCLGKTQEGMDYLQKAADTDHIVANFVLGSYYKNNHSFNPANLKYNTDLANWDKTIDYYTKTTQIIEFLPNYPEGSTEETISTESSNHLSYWLFTQLPAVHLDKYLMIITNTITKNKEKVTDTLDILTKVKESATHCLARPALDIWKKDKDSMKEKQKRVCENLQKIAKIVYPLEEERLQIAQNCQVPLKKCYEHKKILSVIRLLIKFYSSQMLHQSKAPQSEI